jgi:hypothetical protein
MKTAVEWLEEQINLTFYVAEASEINKRFQIVFQQAKQMEKEQIIKNSVGLAKIIISNPIEKSGKTFQELMDAYFKQTFKSE